MNKHTWQKPIYITFKHIKELKAIQVFFPPNVTKMFSLFFQARTVFVFSFSLSAVMSLLKKGLLKWIFQGGNREIVFKEVQLVPNLHSETNHTQKWLMHKKGEEIRDWFLIDLRLDSFSFSWRKGKEKWSHGGSQRKEDQLDQWDPLQLDSIEGWMRGEHECHFTY